MIYWERVAYTLKLFNLNYESIYLVPRMTADQQKIVKLIRSEFPTEYRDKFLNEIEKDAKNDIATAKKGKKTIGRW